MIRLKIKNWDMMYKTICIVSGKIDKYEYLTSEEILPPHQSRLIEKGKFTYTPLGKAFEKQIKTIEDQGKKQAKALIFLKTAEQKPESIEGIFPKGLKRSEIKNEITEIKK